MSLIKITLPDGSVREYESGVTPDLIAESISKSLAKATLAAKLNGQIIDHNHPIVEDGQVELLTDKSQEALAVLRHSAAHLMAQALTRLYPGIHFGVGPAIENGFYYDTDKEIPLTDEDLPKIEAEMKKICLLYTSDAADDVYQV